jgi:hypothetical protein
MKIKALCTAGALCVASLHAVADPVTGSTGGNWVNPSPSGGSIVTAGSGTSNFHWGDGTGFGVGDNSLNFAGGAFASVTESPFKVGTITYFNGTTALGTTPDSVELALTLNFVDPALGAVVSNYAFNLVTTPNTGDADADADFVFLPSSFSTTSFLIGGTTYNVKLTGFQNIVGDGFLASDSLGLHVREGLSASADLYAVVTTQTSNVPEPQSLGLALAALAALGWVRRGTATKV